MFLNRFQALSVSPSMVNSFKVTNLALSVSPSMVNSFKVTNLCKNGLHIRKIWRDVRFWGSKFGRILLHPQTS